MILSINKTQVIIVGAGLSGLFMAAQLLRYGIRPVIIDKRTSPTKTSEYIQISARSMEILKQLGFDLTQLETLEIEGVTFQKRRTVIGSLEYQNPEYSQFPPLQIVKQAQLEQQLIQVLTLNACPIYWNVNLLDWDGNKQYYRLNLEVDKRIHRIQTDWVIGTNDANGVIPRLMKMETAKPRREVYYTTEVIVKESINRNIHFFLSPKGYLQLTPLNGKGTYKILAKFSGAPKLDESNLQIKQYVAAIMGFKLPVKDLMKWTKENNLSYVGTDRKNGRALLINGTAPNDHELFFGESINSAIQGTHNLAWKLAYVLKGKLPHFVLNTYVEERMVVEQKQVRMHRPLFGFLHVSIAGLEHLRDKLIRELMPWIKRNPKIYSRTMNILGQTHTNYRNSPLSVHLSSGKKLRAGDRLPDLPLYHEKEKDMTNLHHWCAKAGFILLILGDVSENQLFIMAQWIQQKYAQHIHLFYLPFSPRNQSIFQTFNITRAKRKMVLVRPDMHIACLHDDVNTSLIDTYMTEVLQWKN